MISSMTGFARGQSEGDWGMLVWEIRAVNHRYLDVSLRVPEALRELEQSMRELMQQQLQRGKVEGNLKFYPGVALTPTLNLNHQLLKQLVTTQQLLVTKFKANVGLDLTSLLQWPGMAQEVRHDLALVKQEVMSLLQSTVADLINVRQREGQAIEQMLTERLAKMSQQIVDVSAHLPEILLANRKKLSERLAEIVERVDDARLEQELVYYAQRTDVSEELDRLVTHVAEVERVIQKGGAVGRRLDFLMQELNREANTLASKSVSGIQTQASVELKVLIEQMREQVQNLV